MAHSFIIILAIHFCLILQLSLSSPAVVIGAAAAACTAVDLEPIEPLITQIVDSAPINGAPLDPMHTMLHGEAYFQTFMKKYGKVYHSYKEYTHRLSIFKRNLERALHHQTLDPSATHGITPYSDLSEEEFANNFLGLHSNLALPCNGAPAPILPVGDLPETFDWREHGAITEVKTQGLCGACWAFTTTGVIEGAYYVASGKLLNLSEQQLVDCDNKCDPTNTRACDSGCHGGLMTNAYEYVMEAGGLMNAKDYPYIGKVEQCKFDRNKVAVKVDNFSIISLDEDQIAANLVKHGPLAIGLNAVFMQTYVRGVSCPLICSKHFVNHGVLLVGYQDSGYAPLRLSNKPYWIIKNSWGPHWGEQGFYKLCRGTGECGMNTMVSAVAARVSD
ncbi:hypothetical protein GOP47_0026489 [Adiantum capillus-veneris]|nr:hypothetical protein GOP47_0026489 [Adiantum capillus-veneris]